jgi:DNA polymerase-4
LAETLCRNCTELVEPDDGAAGNVLDCPICGSTRIVTHPELQSLGIAHIDCDAFYASVEKRDNPALRDVPLIVGGTSGRGVVTTACYIARRFGVRSAMQMFQAQELCPRATVIPPDMAKYRRVSAGIREIFEAATEVIEPVSLDEAYLDLSPDNLLGDVPAAQALALIARRVEREIGITVSIGFSANKFLAKLASEMHKPRGFSIIGQREARKVLAPMPVSKINGVGTVTARRLTATGLETIGDLQRLSEAEFVARLGKFGRRLSMFARGEDDRPVTPHRAAKSISAETTFRTNTASTAELLEIAAPLCDRVATALERKGKAGGTVVMKLKTADFRIITRNRRLPHPTQRAAVLLAAARPLIEAEADGRFFRLLGIGVDHLYPATAADPPTLFGEEG